MITVNGGKEESVRLALRDCTAGERDRGVLDNATVGATYQLMATGLLEFGTRSSVSFAREYLHE